MFPLISCAIANDTSKSNCAGGSRVTSLEGIKEVKTALYSEKNRHFAALTLIMDRKIAVIQDGFMPLASRWEEEVRLCLSCLLSLSEQEAQAVNFDPSQVNQQNALSLDDYRSCAHSDSDGWTVVVGKSIDQTRNGTECGYICAHNILKDVGGDEVTTLSDHQNVRAYFWKKFCELIEQHADVIKFPVRTHKGNQDWRKELEYLEPEVPPAKRRLQLDEEASDTISNDLVGKEAGGVQEDNYAKRRRIEDGSSDRSDLKGDLPISSSQSQVHIGCGNMVGNGDKERSYCSDSDDSDCENDDFLLPPSQVYDDRKCKEGREKDKISLSAFELVRSMMVMSAADSMRACGDCFALIQEENDTEVKRKATPLMPYELGTVLRMFPNPNPSRATNVNCDTLIQTILPPARSEESSRKCDNGSIYVSATETDDSRSGSDSEMEVDVVGEDMVNNIDGVIPASQVHVVGDETFEQDEKDASSCWDNSGDGDPPSGDAYPLKQRLSLDNNEVDDSFCNTVFQCVQAALSSNPPATGMYQKEYQVPKRNIIPDPVHVEKYLEFVKASLKSGSKMHHHRHNQYTEAVPEKVRKDSTSYKTFLRNLSHNFGQKFREIVKDSTTDPGGKPDRRKVLIKLAGLLAESCKGTKMEQWVFVAHQSIANVNELYEGEPLGEAKLENIPIHYGSTTGVQYLNRVPTKRGQPKKAPKKRKKKCKIYFLSDVITEEEAKAIFQEVNSLTDTELAVLLFYRDQHGAVRSMYNGRAFGYDDIEHWDCKVYHVAKGRSNGWQVTLKPKSTKPYCRPFKHNNEILQCSPGLLRIFGWARACFFQLTSEKKLCTPSSLLFKEEREKLKETIQNMKKIEDDEGRYRTEYIQGWSQYNVACGLSV